MDFWIKDDKNTLEAYRDSYAQAAGNDPSTKSKVPKIGNKFKTISSTLILYSPQGNYSITPKTFLLNFVN